MYYPESQAWGHTCDPSTRETESDATLGNIVNTEPMKYKTSNF